MSELKPVPTVHVDEISIFSLLQTPVVPRRSPRKRKFNSDELPFFYSKDKVADLDSFNAEHSAKKNLTSKDFAIVYNIIKSTLQITRMT